jgi:hypothetical protein
VHLGVRKDGKFVDPFDPSDSRTCRAAQPLWSADAMPQLHYEKSSVIGSGFASRPFELSDLEEGRVPDTIPAQDWPALIFYGWAINLSAGDTVAVRIDGPGGKYTYKYQTLDRPKAQYFFFAGMKRPAEGWPAGPYKASFTVTGQDGNERTVVKTADID